MPGKLTGWLDGWTVQPPRPPPHTQTSRDGEGLRSEPITDANVSCLPNGSSIKTNLRHLESFWVGQQVGVLWGGHHRGCGSSHPSPHLALGTSSVWLFLSRILLEKTDRVVNETVFLNSTSRLRKLPNLRRGSQEPLIYSGSLQSRGGLGLVNGI